MSELDKIETRNLNPFPDLLIPGFEIVGLVGEGGHGVVYKARYGLLDRFVAIKVIRDDGSEDLRAQFGRIQREAKLLAKLSHPNIVQVFQVGACADGRPYLACEFLAGTTLDKYILKNGKLGKTALLAVFSQILDALQYAHDNNLIHRDIKPGNIMVLEDGESGKLEVKILDFGIARDFEIRDEQNPGLTHSTILSGSPAYMSPEQCRGEKLDNKSDLYSAACVLYECICGVPPYSGDSLLEIQYKHVHESPDFGRAELKHSAFRLSAFLERALSKEPLKRPSSAALFKDELTAVLSEEPSRRLPSAAMALFVALLILLLTAALASLRTGAIKTAKAMGLEKKSTIAAAKPINLSGRLSQIADRMQGLDLRSPSTGDPEPIRADLDRLLGQTKDPKLLFAVYYLKARLTMDVEQQKAFLRQSLLYCRMPDGRMAFEAAYCYLFQAAIAGGEGKLKEQERLLKSVLAAIQASESGQAPGSLELPKSVIQAMCPSLHMSTVFDLARNAEEQGNYRAALDFYRTIVEKYPRQSSTGTYTAWAELLIKLGERKKAKQLLDQHLAELKLAGANLPAVSLGLEPGPAAKLRQLRSIVYLARWQYKHGFPAESLNTLDSGHAVLEPSVYGMELRERYEQGIKELEDSRLQLKRSGRVKKWDYEKMPEFSYLAGYKTD